MSRQAPLLKNSSHANFSSGFDKIGHDIFSTEAAVSQVNKPSLADLGLDGPPISPAAAKKISIERLQRESEIETAEKITSQKPEPEENLLGVVGFCLSILAIVTVGCLSPVSLMISLSAMKKKPRSLATALFPCMPSVGEELVSDDHATCIVEKIYYKLATNEHGVRVHPNIIARATRDD